MSFSVPAHQRAAVLPTPDPTVRINISNNHPVPHPSTLAPNECLVRLTHSGVCHSDLSIRNGTFMPVKSKDLVGGHEGIGIVVAIGGETGKEEPLIRGIMDESGEVKVGMRVGIRFFAKTCLKCEMCRKGFEAHCPYSKASGFSIDGTFAEYVVSYIEHLTPIPESLDSAEATAIMCAGLTVYRALKYSGTQAGDWVVVPGAGGGLGHLAIQYAAAMGFRVIAIDTGLERKRLCLSLGATHWIDFATPSPEPNRSTDTNSTLADIVSEVLKLTDGRGAHAAIVTAHDGSAYDIAANYLRPAGYLMVVGLPPGATLNLPIRMISAKGLTIRGSFVGNRQDAIEAVAIAASGRVRVRYSIRGLSEINEVFDEMEAGKLVGRVVLDISK